MGLNNVWVITDQGSSIAELCGGGRQLGNKVSIVLFGGQEEAKAAAASGADQVYLIPNQAQVMMESASKTIAKLLCDENAQLIMIHASTAGKLIAGKIAAILGTALIANMSSAPTIDEGIIVEHMVYGGVAFRKEKVLSDSVVVTVGSGVFAPGVTAGAGNIVEMAVAPETSRVRIVETRAKQGEIIHLATAKKVVGFGRGFAKQESLTMGEDFASEIGAETACTRPVAEGEKWMPKERYVGVSGIMLKPEVYVALGISGQIQHMVGVNPSKIIIAINKDKNAPIFKNVDYGLVADLNVVLPQIIEKL